MNRQCLPHIVVVYESSTTRVDIPQEESTLKQLIQEELRGHPISFPAEESIGQQLNAHPDYSGPVAEEELGTWAWIESRIGTLSIVAVSKTSSLQERAEIFRSSFNDARQRVRRGKTSSGLVFTRNHLYALLERSIKQFCTDYQKLFSLAHASRPVGFDTQYFTKSVECFLKITNTPQNLDRDVSMKRKARTDQFQMEMLASSIMLACYPPSSHCESEPQSAVFTR
jgi:hypothetical protein